VPHMVDNHNLIAGYSKCHILGSLNGLFLARLKGMSRSWVSLSQTFEIVIGQNAQCYCLQLHVNAQCSS
jgi:hypothetical protein